MTHYLYKRIALIVLSEDIQWEPIQFIFQKHAKRDKIGYSDEQQTNDHYAIENPVLPHIFLTRYSTEGFIKTVWEQADYIYLMISEKAGPIELGKYLAAMNADGLTRLNELPCDIVIVHESLGPYKDTLHYYQQHAFKRHHHITSTTADYQRVYRYMTGQAIGLVISGGGFRGYAHYGLVKALFEAKIPIDYIGGSSMGATIGALLSMDFTWSHFDEEFHAAVAKMKKTRPWKHLTFPKVSILSGWSVTHMLQEMFGETQIEDLPLNFFCVTGNLSEGQKEIKTQGSLWEWIRASVAIPGIFPPLEKDGMIYVDGGVCTSLPVLDMREHLDNAGTIITFDVRIPPFHRKNYSFPPILTFKDYILDKCGFSKRHYSLPAMMDVIMEASFINQHMYDNQGARKADIIIAPDTSEFSFRDMVKSVSLILIAHELAQEKFKETKALYERWVVDV